MKCGETFGLRSVPHDLLLATNPTLDRLIGDPVLLSDNVSQRGVLYRSNSSPHEALGHFEKALGYWPNHIAGVVGLSELLLDMYAEKIPADAPEEPFPAFLKDMQTRDSILPTIQSSTTPVGLGTASSTPAHPSLSRSQTSQSFAAPSTHSTRPQNGNLASPNDANEAAYVSSRKAPEEPTPDVLNRLAARDRAYFLLSTLTKLGSGWDYSEAWFALARVHEESGQVEKAKEVLWWCVELEDSRPLRPWACAGLTGYLF